MFTEESFENRVIECLKELNYNYIHVSNQTRDNKEIPESSIDYAIKKSKTLKQTMYL